MSGASTPRVRGPRWKDARLIVGVLLILVSVAAGVRVFAFADRTTAIWAAARDLDAGSVLARDDLVRRQVRLLDVTGEYLGAGSDSAPVGYTLTRAVGEGELVPSAAVRPPGKAEPRRNVAVRVERGHVPPGLSTGQRVDVYVTPDGDAAEDPPPSELVLAGAVVAQAGGDDRRLGTAGGGRDIVLAVPPRDVGTLVEAIRHGQVDLVGRPLGGATDAPEDGP